MRPFTICFILMVYFGDSTQLIDGHKVPSQTLRTVVRNTEITLRCPHTSPKEFGQRVTWLFSPMDSYGIKPISDYSRFKLVAEGNSLLIRNVTIEDAGMFFCCFDGPCMDTFLVVLDFDNILSFAPGMDDASGEIVVSSKGDFSITAHHGSEFKVEIVKEPMIPICSQLTENVVCHKRRQTNSTSYFIKNANLRNSGQMVIQSSFMHLKESYRLNMLIQDTPVIHMERVHTEDGIKFICHGHAYPPPDFHFSVILDDESHTAPSILVDSIETSNHSIDVRAIATIKHPIAGPGTVECRASNTEGIAYAVAPLFLESFYDENRVFSIHTSSTEYDQLQFEITFSIGSINDGTTGQCKSSFYEFYNSFVFEYNGTRFPVEAMQKDDTWVANFSLIASGDDQVICIAQFKNESRLNKPITLPLEHAPHNTIDNEKDHVERLPIKQIITWLTYSMIAIGLLAIFSNVVIYLLLWNQFTSYISLSNDPPTHSSSSVSPCNYNSTLELSVCSEEEG